MHRLSVKEKIGYGLGDTASNIVFQVVLNFMMFFYTDVFGITAAAAGTLMLVVRLFDMVTDPIMGGIADRTTTRWGSYRPYLLWVAIPYCLLAIAAFTTPDLSSNGKLWYAYLSYALLMTAYTAINIPYGALGGVMTANPHERGVIQGYRFALAMVGGFIVNSSLLYLVTHFGGEDQQQGFQYAMAALSLVALVCFVLCFLTTKERVAPENVRNEKSLFDAVVGIFKDFFLLVRSNREWLIIALASFFLLLIAVMRGGSTLYYAKYYLQCTANASISLGFMQFNLCDTAQLGTALLTIGTLGSIAGAVLTIIIARRVCKTLIFKAGACGFVFLCALMYFVPVNQLWTAIALHTAINFCHTIMVSMVFAMTADSVDWGEYVTGKRITAMTFSGHLFAIKFGAAIGGLLLGWILAGYGYQEPVNGVDQVQTGNALQGIVMLMTIFPALCGIVIFGFAMLYRLTTDRLAEIQQEIKLRTA